MDQHKTDAEYADEIVAIFSSKETSSFLRELDDSSYELFLQAVDLDEASSVTRGEYEEGHSELRDPELFKKGKFISVLKEISASVLPADAKRVLECECRFAPNWSINGQILINPSTKNPIIILNSAIVMHVPALLRVYESIHFKRDLPHLADSSYRGLYEVFIGLCYYCVHGTKHPKIRSGFGADWTKDVFKLSVFSHSIAVCCELFLLLHEFAHIYLGHIPEKDDYSDVKAIHLIERSLEKEFEADRLVLSWIKSFLNSENFDIPLFAFAFLMLSSELMYSLDADNERKERFTYPEYVYRWELAKDAFNIEEYSNLFSWNVDAWLSRILGYEIKTGLVPSERSTT